MAKTDIIKDFWNIRCGIVTGQSRTRYLIISQQPNFSIQMRALVYKR